MSRQDFRCSYSFCIHAAGRIGSSNEGIDIGNGTADAQLDVIALRLNVSLSCTESLLHLTDNLKHMLQINLFPVSLSWDQCKSN